ncbi:MAG: outer membrane protein assembly factor BamA [Deltaproteobacteria bacterium]|nr:outer membrane protein assembly factor BamA [Deltaproteobacteria bacterium]
MRRLLPIITALLVTSVTATAAEQPAGRVLMFPIKVVEKGAKTEFSDEMAAVLGGELTREGDLQVISGRPYLSVIEDGAVDPVRMARIAQRMDAQSVVWGALTKRDEGYGLEVSVMGQDPKVKPRLFSASGKDMEQLLGGIKDLAAQIGRVVFNRPKVGKVTIQGNKRVSNEAILNKLDLKPGTPFLKSAVGEEIRELYSMGFFDDVQIQAEEAGAGEVELKIVLKERPSIKEIIIEGNSAFSKDKILDRVTTKSFTVANAERIRADIAKVKDMYEKEGYYEPEVDFEIKELSPSEANLVFKIKEGQKSYLTKVEFEGRQKLSESELKKILTIKEASWFWFFDESGAFTKEKLEENRFRILAYYMDRGFINVQAGAPKIDINDGRVTVTYPIREGDRFQVRKVDVDGDLVMPADKLRAGLETKPKTWFQRSLIGNDIKALTKIYNNMGYAYADVEPRQQINSDHNFVDITYRINKGQQVTLERVDISGNERTRDKVIRRGLGVSEGDRYNADAMDATKKYLESTELFEAVKLKTSPGSRPDLMNVTVDVLEKKTGSLAAGLGYSSQEGAMGNVNLKEKNLFGLGIVANVKANISGRRSTYEGSVSYPWMFDIPLTGTVKAYDTNYKELNHVRKAEGMGIYGGYPIYGGWQLSTGAMRDSSKISGMTGGYSKSTVEYYKKYNRTAQQYLNTSENSVQVSLSRDTRNSGVLPTMGSQLSVISRFSGFGADLAYSRHDGEAVYYQPLFWKAVMKVRGHGSLLAEASGEPIPFDRRLLLGGIASVRGYQYGEIGPKDKLGYIFGGDRAVYANIECLVPLVQSLNLNGVVFFDAGNAWNAEDSPLPTTVKAGYGAGIRWLSPMGPMRFEYGWKVQREPWEAPGAIAFSMGQLF